MALSLAAIGFGPAAVIRAGDEPRRFADLLTVDGLTEHGVFISPLVLDCVDAVSRIAPAADRPKLLVSRRSMGFRSLSDEDAVIRAALDRGYAVVDPGLMSLPHQVALFKGASRVVGVMGAAMTNIVFARPGTSVVNLAPAEMPDTFFWFLSVLRGLDYTETRCPQVGPVRGNSTWDTDIVLDPALYGRVFDGE